MPTTVRRACEATVICPVGLAVLGRNEQDEHELSTTLSTGLSTGIRTNPRGVDELEGIILAWQMLLKLAPAAAYGRYVPGRSKQTYWSATGLGTSQRQLRYVGSGGTQLPAAPVVPRHERSVYRMSKRSRPPTSQRGKGSKPRRPGDWPRGEGTLQRPRSHSACASCPLYALPLHCCEFLSYRSIAVGCRHRRPAERPYSAGLNKGELKIAAYMVKNHVDHSVRGNREFEYGHH